MSIGEILLKYDTDKNKGFIDNTPGMEHFYGGIYGDIFKNFDIKQNVSILEIGVQKGGSLLAWKEYFKNAYVCGVDIIDCRTEEYKSDDVNFILSDIRNPNLKNDNLLSNKLFDIIIDDGSHHLEDAIFVVQNYLDSLSINGYMIIEDCQNPEEWIDCISSIVDTEFYEILFADLRHVNGNYDDFLIVVKRIK